MTQKRVLLVGGAGYIGSVLTGYLLDRGYAVRCLDLLLYKNPSAVMSYLSHPGYEFQYGDLCSALSVKNALKGVTDVVVLAGLVGDPITKKYPEESRRINENGILGLLDQLKGSGLEHLVFISTCSNYGLIGTNAMAGEDFPLNPLSLYAKSKVMVEQALLSLKGKVDYHPTILRFATAFGLSPRMRFDLTVNEFCREMYLKRPLLVYDADTWRPYCHVLDFSEAICKVLSAPVAKVSFEVFNAGVESNNFTKKMLVDALHDVLADAPVDYKEHGSDPRNYRVDFSKIRDVLGFKARFSIQDGIKEIVRAHEVHLFDQVDENRNFHGNYEIGESALP